MVDGGRIKLRLAALGMKQADLARVVGISPQAISKIVNGETTDTAKLHKIARALETSEEYLNLETDDPGLSAASVADGRIAFRARNDGGDTVDLAEYKVSYGMGASYIHEASVEPTMRTFSRSWVRQFTDSPFEALFWATGNGTSMMPAILENDTLLIDTERRTPRMWDEFWAIDMHGMGMIKALRPGKEGAMRLISINPDWPEEIAYDGEMNIVGRVVAIVRKV